jgi:hypothetical protein
MRDVMLDLMDEELEEIKITPRTAFNALILLPFIIAGILIFSFRDLLRFLRRR